MISTLLLSLLLAPLAFLWGETPIRRQDGKIHVEVDPWIATLVTILTSIAAVKYLDKRPVGSLGLKFHRWWWKELLIGICLGAFLRLVLILLALALQQDYIKKATEDPWSRLLKLIGNARGAIGEELLSRGYPLQVLIEGIGIIPALFVSSALFGLAHVQEQGWLGVVWTASAGMLYAVSYLKTKALWMPIGMHFSFNYFIDLLESFIGIRFRWPIPMVFAALFLHGIASIFILRFRKIEPHPEMEALWQQHIHPAQPWARLREWLANHPNT